VIVFDTVLLVDSLSVALFFFWNYTLEVAYTATEVIIGKRNRGQNYKNVFVRGRWTKAKSRADNQTMLYKEQNVNALFFKASQGRVRSILCRDKMNENCVS
jgi:hypothetical protein